jgi:hypothetical protein
LNKLKIGALQLLLLLPLIGATADWVDIGGDLSISPASSKKTGSAVVVPVKQNSTGLISSLSVNCSNHTIAVGGRDQVVQPSSWGSDLYDSVCYTESITNQTRPSETAEIEDQEYRYQSSNGTQYKYDLSNPSDRIKYGTDPYSRIRDKTNPNVGIDRRMGQYGGGSP